MKVDFDKFVEELKKEYHSEMMDLNEQNDVLGNEGEERYTENEINEDLIQYYVVNKMSEFFSKLALDLKKKGVNETTYYNVVNAIYEQIDDCDNLFSDF